MADAKPVTAWAVVSLASSALGCLAFLALLPLGELYSDLANSSAGVGGVWGAAHVTLAIALCVLGVSAGAVALVRTRRGALRGRALAWAGIALGCSPWLASWAVEGVGRLAGGAGG